VIDLGIVRDVEETADGRCATVTLTPTYSGCPATEVITADVRRALETVYDEVEVRITLSPAWTTDWISDAGRAKLDGYGIAPPAGRRTLPLLVTEPVVDTDSGDAPAACPHCGAAAVECLAEFGSTPCKALWRCTTCREPFDYFKVL
jgi:ring-1,2-phenylacetyl-CoA epoxidase subunit PaaD